MIIVLSVFSVVFEFSVFLYCCVPCVSCVQCNMHIQRHVSYSYICTPFSVFNATCIIQCHLYHTVVSVLHFFLSYYDCKRKFLFFAAGLLPLWLWVGYSLLASQILPLPLDTHLITDWSSSYLEVHFLFVCY